MRLCVDTFHHPYVELEEPIHFPEVPLERGHDLPVEALTSAFAASRLAWFQPPARQQMPLCRSWPECLHFAKIVPVNNALSILSLVRVRATFLGGASSTMERRQGISPAFSSNRIYFHALLIPVQPSSDANSPEIIRYAPGSKVSVQKEAATGWFRPAALFDSPDFTPINQDLSRRFAFGQATDFLNLIAPFEIQYGALALNLLAPIPAVIEEAAPHFAELVANAADADHSVPESTQNYWKDFYAAYHFTRFLSQSGNPHWHFDKFPGSHLL